MRHRVVLMGALLLGTTLVEARGDAAPKHAICADLGATIGVGISSYGAALGWPEKARDAGVHWSFLYYYVQPNWTADLGTFIASKATIAKGLSSMMVITYYNLYNRGIVAKLPECGSDPPCVQATLQRADLMKAYFEDFVQMLAAAKAASDAGVPTLVQVEPDSWGFMMWSFGTEGQSDASKVPVKVKSSGHPDVAAFSDDAGGFGQALLALRDKYAPAVRLGWHASNFRNGTRPEVVTGFYSSMGEWDVIVTEPPHILKDPLQWWTGTDPAKIDTNVTWFQTLSSTTHLPILIWQVHIGAMEHWLFADAGGPALLSRFLSAGVAGLMWEHQCYGGKCPDPSNPDTWRGVSEDDTTMLAAPPPAFGTGAALDLRQDLAAYQKAPIPWPSGSPCAPTSKADAGADGGGSDGGPAIDAGGDAAPVVDSGGPLADVGDGAPAGGDSGCGCEVAGGDRAALPWWIVTLAATLVGRRRRSARRAVDRVPAGLGAHE